MSTLSERINAAMRHANLNQTTLARKAKVKPPSVHAWMNGSTRTMKSETAHAAAKAMGVSATWLITGKGDMLAGVTAAEEIPTYEVKNHTHVEHTIKAVKALLVAAGFEPTALGSTATLRDALETDNLPEGYKAHRVKAAVIEVANDLGSMLGATTPEELAEYVEIKLRNWLEAPASAITPDDTTHPAA